MKRLVVIAAFTFALFAQPAIRSSISLGQTGATNQTASNTDLAAKSAQVDALFTPFTRDNSPGVTVLVMQKGQVIHHKGYGLARLDTKEAIGPDTAFEVASMSKQFTAMAVMILAERGKLSYDDPLSKYLPEFPAYTQKITIRHLLTHTSGLVDVINATWFKAGYTPTSKEVAAFLKNEANPKGRAGERFEYNNTGYLLLALIVEKAGGKSFAKFMNENIFRPLGMSHTLIWDEKKPKIEHLAISYAFVDGAFKPIDPVSDTFIFGAKGVISTTQDLIKWVQALDAPKLVKPETLQLAFSPMKLNDGSESFYGFGFGIGQENGLATIEHPGGYLGYRSNIKRFPSERTTIVVLSNNAQLDGLALARSIGRIYVGDKMVMPQAKLKVDPAVLASYAGKYESETAGTEGLVLEITVQNEDIFITSAIRPKTKLIAKSETEFGIGEGSATVTFKKDDKGNVTSLAVKSRMGIINARRLVKQ
jgi:CubicO group peptidase (beta-lactamase class C family)